MSSVAVERVSRVRISDPKPAYCSGCYRGADETVTFIDFDAAFDGGSSHDPVTGAVITTMDDLHLCEACVKAAAQELNFKADLHRRQLREIRRLEIENDHWRDYARSLEANLGKRPTPELRSDA